MRHATALLPALTAALLLAAAPVFSEEAAPAAASAALTDAVPADALVFTPPKSRGAAYLWALGATVAPIVAGAALLDGTAQSLVVSTGLVLGPSAGQFYAGAWEQGFTGAGIRATAFPAFLVAFALAGSSADTGDGFGDLAVGLMAGLLVSGAFIVTGTTYSLFNTWFAVDRANERARRDFETRMSLAPMLMPVGGAQDRSGMRLAPGMVATVRF